MAALFDFDDLDELEEEAKAQAPPPPAEAQPRNGSAPEAPAKGFLDDPSTSSDEAAAPEEDDDAESEASSAEAEAERSGGQDEEPPRQRHSGGYFFYPGVRRGPEPPPPPPPDPEWQRLRQQCTQVGLCVDWCADTARLEDMLKTVRQWNVYGVQALKDECSKLKIPCQHLLERSDIVTRLCMVVAWRSMSLKQLQQECMRRRIPFFTRSHGSISLETEDEVDEAKEREDLVSRLRQDTFAGSTGPLPAQGIRGIWSPSAGPAPTHMGGAEKLPPPWTGAPAVAAAAPTPTKPPAPPRPGTATPPPEEDAEDGWRRVGFPQAEIWRQCGPRVRRHLPEFPGFRGEPPGPDSGAEEWWSDEEIRTYLFSSGDIRPRKAPPGGLHRDSSAPAPSSAAAPGPGGAHRFEGLRWRTEPEPAQRPKAPAAEEPKPAQQPPPQPRKEGPPRRIPPALARHYRTLGLSPGEEVEEVRKAYRKLALKYHPDKRSDSKDASEFRKIATAYEAICQELKG